MAKRSVHIAKETENYLADRTPQGESTNYSAFINNSIRVLSAIAKDLPELAESEWIELYNVYAGSDLTRLALPLNLASDLLTHHGATIPTQTPCPELVGKLAALDQGQQFAVIDKVRVYWASGE
ncbi:hypothetical protein ACLSZP_09605 [Avibacterium avium]|uniref:hypothetical protein n=1 Tax=Avibacterium avium TaxID=751 RepID=UPI003BF90FE7